MARFRGPPQQLRSLVAKAHVAAKELGLDPDTRRAVQMAVTGHESCADMAVPELERLLRHYREKGWQPKPAAKARTKKLASAPQHQKIRALWLILADHDVLRDSGEPALRAYVRRHTGVGALEWLDVAQASRVIEHLKQWLQRVKLGGEID